MASIERIGGWAKDSQTYGNSADYSRQSERYSLALLRHFFHLATTDVRHLGGGDEPDGVLARNGVNFATVEVRLHMDKFTDDDQPNGSGWPQVNEATQSGQTIALDAGLGTWALWVEPNAGAIRRLIHHPKSGALLSRHISECLLHGADQPLPQDLLELAPIHEIFQLSSGSNDRCVVIPHVPPFGGFFSTSNDHISAFMQERIAMWTQSSPPKRSFVDKWTERAVQLGVSEVHVVGIFESTKEWMKKGIMYQLVDPLAEHPSVTLDLTGFPLLDWNLWLLLRNPINGDFHRAFRFHDSVWTAILE